jgi:hypothetical protein
VDETGEAIDRPVALIHRLEAASRVARAAIGPASWAAWCLVAAIVLATASAIVLVPAMLIGDLFLFAIAGARLSLLAFDGYERRVGKALASSRWPSAPSFSLATSGWPAAGECPSESR